ncbi:hypothetical protein RP20_CCG006211 [Aedes albopictus]|nr:hypothetical protein RP20_CCG006211 [Aedes albopictus]
MVKRKSQPIIDSESSSDSESGMEQQLLTKRRKTSRLDSDLEHYSEPETSAVQCKKRGVKHISASQSKDDESGSSSNSDSEFSDGYDDKMVGDEKDRARLSALSEKEREMEIFERIEWHDAMKTRWEIERKLKLAKKADRKVSDSSHSSPEKVPAGSNHCNLKERSKERKKNVEANRTDNKRNNAMAMLKAKRKGKAKRDEEAYDICLDDWVSDNEDDKNYDRRSRAGSSSGRGSDSRSSIDEETWDSKERKPAAISTKEELEKLRISRHKIERSITLPMFNQVVQNCFVRINIGNNNGSPVYRVAEIIEVVETGKIYQLGQCRTNKGFRLKHGSQERVFRLEFISNQKFSDSEYQNWLSACEATGTALPYADTIEKKQRAFNEAIQYEFKDTDIDKLIKENNRFRTNPTNYAMKKTQLMMQRDAAQLRGEDELARDLNTQIMELEERASTLDRNRSSSIGLISYINDRNRKRNVEDAERAIKEEIWATRGKRIEDPFTRRPTQPRMLFKASNMKKEVSNSQMQALPAPPPPGRKNKADETTPVSSADNNMYSLHDFDIVLDAPLSDGSSNLIPKAVKKPVNKSSLKRSLNLEEYKKRRGFI